MEGSPPSGITCRDGRGTRRLVIGRCSEFSPNGRFTSPTHFSPRAFYFLFVQPDLSVRLDSSPSASQIVFY